jgi:hypothetical protein
VASGVDNRDVPDRFDVLEEFDVDPVVLLAGFGVDACACDASWATKPATPAAATPTRPAVASARRRVPSCRGDRVDVMHQLWQPRMKDH